LAVTGIRAPSLLSAHPTTYPRQTEDRKGATVAV
jgi:hypothetical protein